LKLPGLSGEMRTGDECYRGGKHAPYASTRTVHHHATAHGIGSGRAVAVRVVGRA
jgi:hypothetical protein